MKTAFVAIVGLLVAGCQRAPPPDLRTAAQARALALQLANDKASELYHCRPFGDGPPPRFAAGHWIWTEQKGVGRADMQVTVELAEDGSTNHVDLQVFDSQNTRLPIRQVR